MWVGLRSWHPPGLVDPARLTSWDIGSWINKYWIPWFRLFKAFLLIWFLFCDSHKQLINFCQCIFQTRCSLHRSSIGIKFYKRFLPWVFTIVQNIQWVVRVADEPDMGLSLGQCDGEHYNLILEKKKRMIGYTTEDSRLLNQNECTLMHTKNTTMHRWYFELNRTPPCEWYSVIHHHSTRYQSPQNVSTFHHMLPLKG